MVLPVTISARLFFQQLWKLKCDWDQEIPEKLREEWHKNMHSCLQVNIPRQLCSKVETQLHIFSDASSKAYGAVAYLCSHIMCRFLIAKANISPIKTLTIPKLELTPAVLAARLATFIREAYQDELTIKEIHLWCWSQIALSWLISYKILSSYVQNRVEDVRGLVPEARMHYVPTKDNSSDLITRGITLSNLIQSS